MRALKWVREYWRRVLVLTFCAGLPLLMAPSGGFPSRPRFQQATLTTSGATSTDLFINQTGAPANNRIFRVRNNGAGQFQIGAFNDALSTGSNFFVATVSGATPTVDGVALAGYNGVRAFGAATGATNVAFFQVQDSAGTRMGYIGDDSTGDSDITIGADAAGANLDLVAGSGGAVRVNGTAAQASAVATRHAFGAFNGGGACSVAGAYASSGISSCARTGAGTYTVTFSAGTFTGNFPVCTANVIYTASGELSAIVRSDSLTQITVLTCDDTAGVCGDENFVINCMGT